MYFLCDRKMRVNEHIENLFALLSTSILFKVPKNSAHGKNLHKRPLLTPHIASPRSGVCSSLQASACFQGAAELDLHGYTRKVIPAQIFKQSSHNGLKTSGLALDFSTVPFRPWRGITFVMKVYRHASWSLTRTMVMSRKTGTVKGHNLNPGDFWIK